MLRKGVYPYEYMGDGKILNETILPEIKNSYCHLNMKDTTSADYMHRKRVCKDFDLKNLEEYHQLYVQSDTLLLADVFENSQNICLEIYELDAAHFLTAAGLSLEAVFKNTKD